MKKILAIDDQKDNLRTIEAVIETYIPNCKVLTALSGKEGILLAKKEQPDIILLDIIMPETDGYEVCKRLKEDESTSHIPVVMLTAYKTDINSKVRGLEIGADAFLLKPIDPVELSSQVKVMLRIKSSEQILAQKEIDKHRHHQSMLMDNLPVITLILKKHTREIVTFNKLAQERGAVVGKTCHESLVSCGQRCPFCLASELWESNEPQVIEAEYKGKYWEGHWVPYTDDLYIHYIWDISERKMTEEKLNKITTLNKTILDSAGEGIYGLDLNGNTTFANPAAAKMLGWKMEEILNKNLHALLHHSKPDGTAYDSCECPINATYKDGKVRHVVDEVFWRKDGSCFPVEYISTPLRNEQGELKGAVVTFKDVTERKHAEKTLIKSEHKFSLLAEFANDWEYWLDENGNYVYLSQACEKITGYSPEEFMKNSDLLHKLVIPEHKDMVFNHYKKENMQEPETSFEFCIYNKNGDLKWIEHNCNQVIGDKGECKGRRGSNRDITKRKLSEKALKKALKRATESDRLKSAFLATMSHELRTPLNAVIGFSDLIDEETTISKAVQFSKTINESGNHLLSIVEDLFDITLIEAGEINIKKEDTDLNSLLQNVHQIAKAEQQKTKKNHLDLSLIIPSEYKELVITTDSSKLKQVLLNLLKNALKFTHNGHVNYGFIIENLENNPRIKFYVEDTGIGISKDKQEFIYDAFRQVDETKTKVYGGTGIGLSISKKLTEILGGEIWIESEEGKGSTFYFTIPFTVVKDSKSIEKLNIYERKNKFANKTILVVEDDESSYDFLEIILGKLGINTMRAPDGVEAIKCCQEEPKIDLVLMDINMPVMNGFIATKKIKEFRPKLPIIAQTAYAIAGDKEKVLEAGCDDYISKPINKDILKEKLLKFLKYKPMQVVKPLYKCYRCGYTHHMFSDYCPKCLEKGISIKMIRQMEE